MSYDDVLFDFPCSDTFRRYEDHLLGRESLPRLVPDIEIQKEQDRKAVERRLMEMTFGIEEEPQEVQPVIQETAPKPQPKPIHGIEGL